MFVLRTSVNLGSALPGAARHIYHSRRESANFSSFFTVIPVFTGCTAVRLVFSAVPPQPSVPSPAVGGRGEGEGVQGPVCWMQAGLSFDLS